MLARASLQELAGVYVNTLRRNLRSYLRRKQKFRSKKVVELVMEMALQ